MLLFWHYQKPSQLDPGVKISYDILTPPLDIFVHLPTIPTPPTPFNFCTIKNYPNLTRVFYLPFIFTWEDVSLYQIHFYDAIILHYQHMISQSYK